MDILEDLPLWVLFIGTVLIVLLATEVGFRLGLWLHARYPTMGKASMTGPLIGGMMGLLAFLLALTFGAAVGQHMERKAMVVTEIDESGSVPELKVSNEAVQSALLLDGEELIGAKQNRVLNTTILIAPKREWSSR